MIPLNRLKITILIPCHNEEKGIRQCILSCINQTRKADQIIIIDDASTDNSVEIMEEFASQIEIKKITKNLGNKSYVQEYGLQFVTGDIFIATDGDTLLDEKFIENIEKNFLDPAVVAVGGYVKSRRYNWLTAVREIDYIIGQNIHKRAQGLIDFMHVVPGCAGAFKTEIFKKYITFDHDTVTEDLDFTYKFHKENAKVIYDIDAIVYTQDPPTLHSYINQMRRWYGGGWQNLKKHYRILKSPLKAMELCLMYIEGLVFSLLLFIIPFINLPFFVYYLLGYFILTFLSVMYASWKSKRADLIMYAPAYMMVIFINAYIFIEQFIKEMIFNKKILIWHQPERVTIN